MLTIKKVLPLLLSFIVLLSACQKNYYDDTGTHIGDFDGTVMEYLDSKPEHFNLLSGIIRHAGMESIFSTETITFFAPSDSSIRKTLDRTNDMLAGQGLKTVTNVTQIKPAVWQKFLSRYIFRQSKSMMDFPQIDPENLSAFPGQVYASHNNELMNIGVVYNDAGGVQYAGYRQLLVSYIPASTPPRDFSSWYSARVASVNIKPTNGYVHVLNYNSTALSPSGHFFGFNEREFFEEASRAGID